MHTGIVFAILSVRLLFNNFFFLAAKQTTTGSAGVIAPSMLRSLRVMLARVAYIMRGEPRDVNVSQVEPSFPGGCGHSLSTMTSA